MPHGCNIAFVHRPCFLPRVQDCMYSFGCMYNFGGYFAEAAATFPLECASSSHVAVSRSSCLLCCFLALFFASLCHSVTSKHVTVSLRHNVLSIRVVSSCGIGVMTYIYASCRDDNGQVYQPGYNGCGYNPWYPWWNNQVASDAHSSTPS